MSKNKEQAQPAFTHVFRIPARNSPAKQDEGSNLSNLKTRALNIKNSNRHTVASPNDNFDKIIYQLPQHDLAENAEMFTHRRYQPQESVELSNSQPKTPDSTSDMSNWYESNQSSIGDASSRLLDEPNDTDEEPETANKSPSLPKYERHSLDDTTRRLERFVGTTLLSEETYLKKITLLLNFRSYLEENLPASITDIHIIFCNIHDIYKVHEVVVLRLKEFIDTFTEDSNVSSNIDIKELFSSKALQLLGNIIKISFPTYLEFVQNYPRSMAVLKSLEKANLNSGGLLSKKKTLADCQNEFMAKMNRASKETSAKKNFFSSPLRFSRAAKEDWSIYVNDSRNKMEEKFDVAAIFSEDILRRPEKLFLFIHSLKDECLMAANELPIASRTHDLKSDIKMIFDNEEMKELREKVFEQIKLNIMPKEARRHEDVVELCESSNEKKIRHLILYGDCLVCCRLKKDKRQLKWSISIDRLDISTDNYKSAKTENELKQLKEEIVSLRGDLKNEENISLRNQLRIKKKLAEHENELTLQSSRLKLIICAKPSNTPSNTSGALSALLPNLTHSPSPVHQPHRTNLIKYGSGGPHAVIGSSMTNLSLNSMQSTSSSSATSIRTNITTAASVNSYYNSVINGIHSMSEQQQQQQQRSYYHHSSSSSHNNLEQYVFLFTSDFERNAWVEEINSAIYAYQNRKHNVNIVNSDIESRINALKKIEEPPKVVSSSCTGSLELHIKQIDQLPQPNYVYVAVELKSCGSYLQVAQTNTCKELTTSPVWNEKFNLELQCVDSLRIILYCQTSGKALAISSQELKIDSNVNLNKINCAKLSNGIVIHLAMKFLSPKKTITRRRTRNRNDIFGGNLAELLQKEKTKIPRILKDCVEVIETKGIDEVGIYRVSSVVSEVQKMKDLYSKNPNQALNELRQKSPHLSANVLKLYLRELPDPLFSSDLYDRFMTALDRQVPEFRSVELCRIFNDLPETNKTIILFILNHLLNIANRSDKNLMSLQNLSTLFGPSLMKLSPNNTVQADDMAKEIRESMQQAQVLFFILKLHSEGRLIVDQEQQQQSPNESTNQSSPNSSLNSPNLDKNNNNLNKSSESTPSHESLIQAPSISTKDERTRSNIQTAL